MKTKFKLQIEQEESDFLNTDQPLYYYLEARDDNDSDTEFNISNIDIKKFRVEYAEKDSLSIDLFDYIKRPKADCTFIHLFCYLATTNPRTLPVPRRFTLKINSDAEISFSISETTEPQFGDPSWITLGKMSQFTIGNVAEFDCDLLISNFDLSSGETVNFIIVVGLKN